MPVTSRLSTNRASAVRTHTLKAAGHCNLQARPTTACFSVPCRNQLGVSGDPRLERREEDGHLKSPLGQLKPNMGLLLWDMKFSHLWVSSDTGDGGICLPAQPALSQGLQMELEEWPKGRRAATPWMCQSTVANAFRLGRQTTTAPHLPLSWTS